ncbi:MAG: M20/M25/M40 family metallo-hydrolase [Balneolales bacterium]|nr:M20/M25/M40 family metallo-hydrolase [Balneolales bacterium]
MRYHFLLVSVLVILLGCSQPYSIQQSNVAEIVETLSSDNMKGRRVFTKDVERAEKYIADNFKKADLSYYPGLDSYKQSFIFNEMSIKTASVNIEGSTLPNTRFFALMHDTAIVYTEENVQISFIEEGENFRRKIRRYSSSKDPMVVFIDNSFEEIFESYRNYYSRPTAFIDGKEESSVVFVMSQTIPDNFEIEIKADHKVQELNNIVGVIEGKRKDEIVLFSAHHDHIGIRNVVDGDSIANGANDNASGVTAVIELAKYFSSLPQPERTIVFTTFTAEEVGGFGSQYFSRQVEANKIIAMFNIEMIGKPAVSGPNTAWITGYNLSTFGELLSQSTMGSIYEFYPDPYPQENLFYRSDNIRFARKGIPAHTISTTPIDVDTDYHTVHDEFHTLNLTHLTNTIKAIAQAAEGIISGRDTPSRIDTEFIN